MDNMVIVLVVVAVVAVVFVGLIVLILSLIHIFWYLTETTIRDTVRDFRKGGRRK